MVDAQTAAASSASGGSAPTTIDVRELTFALHGPPILTDINLQLPAGSRCLLIGANGAGKSTLLRVLAGKRMVNHGRVDVLGYRAFFDNIPDLTYLGTEWATNPVVRGDLPVSRLLSTSGASTYPERTTELLEIMDANPEWRMNATSDGERRRVQIVMGLMKPFKVLLLDEVTVDLDVVVRQDLLAFHKKESEQHNATIVYATHIFDGLGSWPTHVAHMSGGRIKEVHAIGDIVELVEFAGQKSDTGMSPLMRVVEKWLRQDLAERRAAGKKYDEARSEEIKRVEVKQYGLVEKAPQQLYDYWKST